QRDSTAKTTPAYRGTQHHHTYTSTHKTPHTPKHHPTHHNTHHLTHHPHHPMAPQRYSRFSEEKLRVMVEDIIRVEPQLFGSQ
ncbi:hypothetical protein NDU88_001300, partial [Pleurodeles waltl]